MDEQDYITFVLGYDLLHDDFDIRNMECDTAFDIANEIAKCFLKSDYYTDYQFSMYDALQHYISENRGEIESFIADKGERYTHNIFRILKNIAISRKE